MPQASDEKRDLMDLWFGDRIDEQGPYQLLMSRGYTEEKNGLLRKPTPSHTIHMIEWECISFLIDEWNFYLLPD